MLKKFEKEVVEYCTQHRLFPEKSGKTVLVALSGGGDSVALLTVLLKAGNLLGISVEAAHLNHSLRGGESGKDESFCRDLCSRLGIHLTVERLREGEIAGSKDSIETAARELRLAFLKQTAVERKAVRIATGHTLDDQVETVLHRILRGTGPSGLAGILPSRDNLCVRPLLGMGREKIRGYLEDEGIPFREDSTNRDTAFFRNRIRHELIPFLKSRFSPGVKVVVSRLAELSRIQENYLAEITLEAFQNCCLHEDSIKILLDKRKFIDYHKVVKQLIIRHCLEILEGSGRDTDMDEVENILSLFSRDHGSADITSSLQCGVGRDTAAFIRRSEPYEPIPLKLPGETVIPAGCERIIAEKVRNNTKADGSMTVLVSPGIAVKYGDISIGQVKRGESMVPFGMREEVKIRDLISASPLPKVLRHTVLVVRAGAMPIWIPGIRSSECLRIPGSEMGTDEALLLTYKDGIRWY